jgi:putative type II restriction endonuclease
MLTLKAQKKAAKNFAEKWLGIGDEKQDTQRFWIELLQTVYGVENASDFIRFEQKVKLENISYIDAMIPATHTMIEQKSIGKSLTEAIKQSDGTKLTPLEQAKRYSANLPYSDRPRWIIGCNFSEFQILDMDNPNATPEIIYLKDFEKDYYRLNFMVNVKDSHIEKELEISKTAGELVGRIYDILLKQYKLNKDLSDTHILQNINKLCVRIVFCLYAEDAGLFGSRALFHDYLREFKPQHFRKALLELFRILDTPIDARDPFDEEELLAFPYVNGNLFSEIIDIPPFNEDAINILLKEACSFNWSEISPTIFGGIFESTLNPDTRRSGGMHYTSLENIHKVIDPLFLEEYKEKFRTAMDEKVVKKRLEKLNQLQDELASLTFFDPAAGSGNFLTETYLSLRRLENDILRETITDKSGSGVLGFEEAELNPIKVSIQQFYGIEINDFAVAVARTAMWIAEAQMFEETEGIINREMDFLPLHSFTNIHEKDALEIEWSDIIKPDKLSYMMGNPPFAGKKEQTVKQKEQLIASFKGSKGVGNLDYVTAWYAKAAEFVQNTTIKCAFVSTNSIVQGEQAPVLWEHLSPMIQPIFAYRSFKWDSDARNKAAVHCVIIGFTASNNIVDAKYIYNGNSLKSVKHISAYLTDMPMFFIKSRTKPISNVLEISYGSMGIDNKHFSLTHEDVEVLLKEDKSNIKFIRTYLGGVELIRNTKKWCLWLKDFSPSELKQSSLIMDRIHKVKEFRLSSSRPQTKKLADIPWLFGEIRQPNSDMLVIPKVSSQTRRYIPIDFVDKNTIVSGSALIIPEAGLYEFGVLMSNIHNAWMRAVAGRMKSDYQYSGNIVYNNFPWPVISDIQKKKIEKTAQEIINARNKYPNESLATLYDDTVMPIELLTAHRNNNRAVMEAYGFDIKMSESDCVYELIQLYKKIDN